MHPAGFFAEPEPGLFIIHYRTVEDLTPAKQAPLIEAVRGALEVRAVGLMFILDAKVRSVPIEVPAFWLGVTRELPLTAMAVVSRSLAVRMATSAFAISNTIQRSPMATDSFEDETSARLWMRERLANTHVAFPPAA